MRRGDIRAAVLSALLEGPAHGYEIIRRLESRSGGTWRPSAGSVYPTLQLLEEEGLLSARDDGGKRVYDFTDSGRAQAEAESARPGSMPWDQADSRQPARGLRAALSQLFMAARQVAEAGNAEQVDRASAIVAEARQKLYQILAEQ